LINVIKRELVLVTILPTSTIQTKKHLIIEKQKKGKQIETLKYILGKGH
jgi:hypothetical protein